MPNGANILPSIPERKKRGTKLATIIRVEFKIGIRTSLEASKTTVRTFFCSSLGFCLFSRKRLNTFSTSTIASSTKEPIAMAIPPRLHRIDGKPQSLQGKNSYNNRKRYGNQ